MTIGSLVLLPSTTVDVVCEAWGVSRAQVYADVRYPRVVEARWVIWYICRQVTPLSYPELGVEFGKDHTTVLHGVQKITQRLATDADLRKRVATVVAHLEERKEQWQTTNSAKSTTSSEQRLA